MDYTLLDRFLNIDRSFLQRNIDRYLYGIDHGEVPQGCPPDFYLRDDGGLAEDNFKPISIIITNWERGFYIPFIIAMYSFQEYPKELLEFIIVDDNSSDKENTLNICKKLSKEYPEFKIRYIQNYISKKNIIATRRNMGIRHASHDIILMNESDNIPFRRDFLKGISYSHSLKKNLCCMPLACHFILPGDFPHGNVALNFSTIEEVFNLEIKPHDRLAHDYIISMDKESLFAMHGYNENVFGYSGHEDNLLVRFYIGGGRIHLNTYILSGNLPNFPFTIPEIINYKRYKNFDNEYMANINSWGITENFEEIDLYKEN